MRQSIIFNGENNVQTPLFRFRNLDNPLIECRVCFDKFMNTYVVVYTI